MQIIKEMQKNEVDRLTQEHCGRCFERDGISRRKAECFHSALWSLRVRKRETGARAQGRAFALAFAIVFALAQFFAPFALAAGSYNVDYYYQYVYGPVTYDWQGQTYNEVGVCAPNRYDAALFAAGFNAETIRDLDLVTRYKLSNADFNGSFGEFVDKFVAPSPTDTTISGSFVGPGFWGTAYAIYGEGNLWAAEFTNDLKSAAHADAALIIKGGTASGGGGGSVEVNNYHLYAVESYKPNAPFQVDYVAVTNTLNDKIDSLVSSGNKLYINVSHNSTTKLNVSVFVAEENACFYANSIDVNGKTYEYALMYNIGKWYRSSTYKNGYTSTNLQTVGNYKNCLVLNSTSWDYDNTQSGSNTENALAYDDVYFRLQSEVQVPTDPTLPPDYTDPGGTPVSPTPPELPEPGDPVSPTPPESDPQPTTPTVPPSPGYDGPNIIDVTITGTDIQALIDALDEHCKHLQAAIKNNFDAYYNAISPILSNEFGSVRTTITEQIGWLGTIVDDNLVWIGNSVNDNFTALKTYLKELFDWLGQQLTFVDSQTDTSDILHWLKQIWAKLGSGISTQPVDPVVEPDNWWDWLMALLGDFAAQLANIGGDKVSDIVDLLDQLKGKFPFSLPWDAALLLGLLVAPPQTPTMSLPQYTVNGEMQLVQAGTYNINLGDYDVVWNGVRWMERIAFCMFLIMHTNDFLSMLRRVGKAR